MSVGVWPRRHKSGRLLGHSFGPFVRPFLPRALAAAHRATDRAVEGVCHRLPCKHAPCAAAPPFAKTCQSQNRKASANFFRLETNKPAKRPHPGLTREEAARCGLIYRSHKLSYQEQSGSLRLGPQGSSAFFWEIKRRTRSARSAPSNGFLNASLNPSAKVSSPGSSLVSASRIVPM